MLPVRGGVVCGGMDVGGRADVCPSDVHLLLFAPGGCVPPRGRAFLVRGSPSVV